MDKQQLKHLEEEIRAGTAVHDEYSPTRPCPSALEENGPYEYAIDWYYSGPHAGQYLLDLIIWSDYYHYHATREQPEEKGWATQENIAVWSPYLSELLTQLEDRDIPLPSAPSTWSNPCPGVYVRGTWTRVSAAVIGTPLPSPTMKVKCKGCGIDMVVPRQPAHDWWCPICALKPDA